MSSRLLVAFGLVLAACHGGAPVAGGSASYLLVDAEARASGWQLELADGWVGAPVLPIELRPGERVTLRGLGARVPVDAEPGSLGWLRGATARLEWLDVGAADRLVVDGSDSAVRALATSVDGRATPRDDGRWALEAVDLFGRVSFLEPPEGLRDAQPTSGLAATHPPRSLVGGAAIAAPIFVAPTPASGGDGTLALVGAYHGNGGLLVLDGAGGFRWSTCGADTIAGTWRPVDGYVQLESGGLGLPPLAIRGETLASNDGTLLSPLSDENLPVNAADTVGEE